MNDTDMPPAAFQADYRTFRHLKTSGGYKIEFEIPAHSFRQMYAVLGDPPENGKSVWVAIARLADADQG